MDRRALVAQLILRLTRHDATLATAESLTGGMLAEAFTAVPGASQVYVGGVVAYASEVKTMLLGVPEDLISEYGVVSAECARAMAEGVRHACGSTYAVSTTGVAGPELADGHPVGTVYVGIAGPEGTEVVDLLLEGDREGVRSGTAAAALSALGARLSMLPEEDISLG